MGRGACHNSRVQVRRIVVLLAAATAVACTNTITVLGPRPAPYCGRGTLGIEPGDVPHAGGALVAEVLPGGPAEAAGVKKNDVVVRVGITPIANACELVADGGLLFISIYNDQGRKTSLWRGVKRLYNRNALGRAAVLSAFVPYWATRGAVGDLVRLRSPLRRYREYRCERGMSIIHDWIDWLGGYPFETARPEAVFCYVRDPGFSLRKLITCGGGLGCNQFVFERTAS